MKRVIKTFGFQFGIFTSLVLSLGIAYAAWDSTVSTGDQLTASSWNALVGKVRDMDEAIKFESGKVRVNSPLEAGNSIRSLSVSGLNSGIEAKSNNSFVNMVAYGSSASGDVYLDTPRLGTAGVLVGSDDASGISRMVLGSGVKIPLQLYTDGRERLRIDDEGNVGIGTKNPSQKLDVNGNISFGGNKGSIGYYNAGVYDQVEMGSKDATTSMTLFTNNVNRLSIAPSGEVKVISIAYDGAGKVVCIKPDETLGTCSTQPDATGACSCN